MVVSGGGLCNYVEQLRRRLVREVDRLVVSGTAAKASTTRHGAKGCLALISTRG